MQAVKGKHPTPSIKTSIYGSHFVTGKMFALLLVMRGSVPDCCIIIGKPDDRVNHIDYVTTLFAFTWPVHTAKKAHTLADQGFDFTNYFVVHGARLQTPSFMRGKRQLCSKEVVMSKKPSEVDIHVERMIGHLKPNTKHYKLFYHFV